MAGFAPELAMFSERPFSPSSYSVRRRVSSADDSGSLSDKATITGRAQTPAPTKPNVASHVLRLKPKSLSLRTRPSSLFFGRSDDTLAKKLVKKRASLMFDMAKPSPSIVVSPPRPIPTPAPAPPALAAIQDTDDSEDEDEDQTEQRAACFRCDIYAPSGSDYSAVETNCKDLVTQVGGKMIEDLEYLGGFLYELPADTKANPLPSGIKPLHDTHIVVEPWCRFPEPRFDGLRMTPLGGLIDCATPEPFRPRTPALKKLKKQVSNKDDGRMGWAEFFLEEERKAKAKMGEQKQQAVERHVSLEDLDEDDGEEDWESVRTSWAI